MYAALQIILPILLFLTSVFLILLVLVQRGRGGGLAGAFGGLGGQSAFGTKAGDVFTQVTIYVAAFWIILCAASVKLLNDTGSSIIDPTLGGAAAPQQPGAGAGPTGSETQPAGGGPAAETESSAPADTESGAAAPASSAPADTESSPPAAGAKQKSDE